MSQRHETAATKVAPYVPARFVALGLFFFGAGFFISARAARAADSGGNAGGNVAAAAEVAPFALVDGVAQAGFDRLAGFKFIAPPFDPKAKPGSSGPSVDDQIPEAIRRLDGRSVVVTGFMLPIKMEGGFVTELLLMRTQMMCCYGVVPQINEWVLVHMAKKGVRPLQDVPVAFSGVLRVGGLYENGFLTAIYQLDGEKMVEAKGS